MTSLAHAEYPNQHPGLVHADRMWTAAFAALAFFTEPIRKALAALQPWLARRAAQRRQAAEDAKLWHLALNDDRVMADLSRAMSAAAVVRNLKTYY